MIHTVNNLTNGAFTQKELNILATGIIGAIGITELGKALAFANIDPTSNPLELTKKQNAFITEILERLKSNRKLSDLERDLINRALEEYNKAKSKGVCKIK